MRNNSYCAVVVTYYPDVSFHIRIIKLLKHFDKIIIIDNGTCHSSQLDIQTILLDDRRLELKRNKTNIGIASALNKGIQYAISAGYAWIALFDQDSLLDDGTVSEIKYAISTYPELDKLLMVGCNIVSNKFADSIHNHIFDRHSWVESSQVITSGSFLSSQSFNIVGKFNEQLFIDYVDIEYCLRIKHHGYKIIKAPKAILYHDIGNQDERKLFKRKIHPTNHPPVRRYYQFRNSLLLLKVYYNIDPVWVKQNIIVLLKIVVGIVLFEPRKIIKLLSIAKGIYHGILGRAGKNGEIEFKYDLNLKKF